MRLYFKYFLETLSPMKNLPTSRPRRRSLLLARYKAPVFGFYVWGKKELSALAEDLETADPAIGQFGAIVLKDLGRPAGGPTSPSTYLLIDGQQR